MAGEVLILDYYGAALSVICQQATKGAPIVIGDTSRAWAGNERSSIRAEKRTWNFRTTKVPTETENAIQAIIARRAQFWASGEALQLNPVIDPLNMTSLQWTRNTMAMTGGVTDPNGGLSAQTATAAGVNAFLTEALPNGANIARTNKLWMRRRTGSGTIQLRNPDGSGFTTQTISATWAPYSLAAAASLLRSHGFLIATNGDAIDVYNATMTSDPVLVSAVCSASDMQAGTYLYEMSLTLFEV